jgi:hypothetical protein
MQHQKVNQATKGFMSEEITRKQVQEWANDSIISHQQVDELTVHEINKEQPETVYVLKLTKRGSSKLLLVDIQPI